MLIRLALLLRGLDLRVAEDRARIPEHLHDLTFEASDDLTYVVMACDDLDAARLAAQSARRIERYLTDVTVVGVHDELVSLTDIAMRSNVGHESVRLWASGKRRASGRPFPRPRQVVGAQSGKHPTKLYLWREVVSWVREVIQLDPDEGVQFLTDSQIAEANARIAQVMPSDGGTTITRVFSESVRTERVRTSLPSGFVSEITKVLEECTVATDTRSRPKALVR